MLVPSLVRLLASAVRQREKGILNGRQSEGCKSAQSRAKEGGNRFRIA